MAGDKEVGDTPRDRISLMSGYIRGREGWAAEVHSGSERGHLLDDSHQERWQNSFGRGSAPELEIIDLGEPSDEKPKYTDVLIGEQGGDRGHDPQEPPRDYSARYLTNAQKRAAFSLKRRLWVAITAVGAGFLATAWIMSAVMSHNSIACNNENPRQGMKDNIDIMRDLPGDFQYREGSFGNYREKLHTLCRDYKNSSVEEQKNCDIGFNAVVRAQSCFGEIMPPR